MKQLRQELYTTKSKHFIKEMEYTEYRAQGISWRRAKVLATRLHIRGTHKKKNVKWVGYEAKANYQRRTRTFYLNTRKELNRIEIEEGE